MRSIARHTVAFGRVFTLVFLLASSGFTTIVHIGAMEASACCDPSGASDHNACPNKQLPLPVAGMSVHNRDGCHRNRDPVVGAFGVVQALVEKDSKAQNVDILTLLTSAFVPPAPGNTSSRFNYSYSVSVSLPSVEKCILNATLVI